MAVLQAALAALEVLRLPQVSKPKEEQEVAAAAALAAATLAAGVVPSAAACARASAEAERAADMELDAEAQHASENLDLEHEEACILARSVFGGMASDEQVSKLMGAVRAKTPRLG